MINRLINLQPEPQQSSVPAQASGNKTQQEASAAEAFHTKHPLPGTPAHMMKQTQFFPGNPQSSTITTDKATIHSRMLSEIITTYKLFSKSNVPGQIPRRDTPEKIYAMNDTVLDDLFGNHKDWKDDSASPPKPSFEASLNQSEAVVRRNPETGSITGTEEDFRSLWFTLWS